ncbi:Hypothetical predicted protein [Xyrichtys novacula]|uniref:Uncharacterized protein n=1 Tax=Xyrichtys novacula TaxID=13765 RepID=A0AAV1EXC2_XYRNO|nr:Hypothetical predicted protein [Xyrichtys novacula]
MPMESSSGAPCCYRPGQGPLKPAVAATAAPGQGPLKSAWAPSAASGLGSFRPAEPRPLLDIPEPEWARKVRLATGEREEWFESWWRRKPALKPAEAVL